MFNKITIFAYIGIVVLFISPSIFTQNISFTEHLVDNNFDGPAGIFVKDVDNDGIIDSYEKSPSWTYTEEGNYSVYLKVSNGQTEDIEIKEDYITSSISGIEGNIIPEKIKLYQNYPNPFNPSTTIRYELPEGSNVIIKIYNLLGVEIRELVSEFQSAGFKTTNWDGKDKNGNSVDSGVYLYSFESNNFSQTKKMMVIK